MKCSKTLKVYSLVVKVYKEFDKISGVVVKKFADKAETKMVLRSLISDMKKLKDGNNASSDTEEAIIFRKPIANQICVSCNKDLPNLGTEAVGYTTWDKFPAKELNFKTKAKGNSRLSMSNDEGEKVLPTIKQ